MSPFSEQAELDEAMSAGRRPTVFMFQPTKFEAIAPDRLVEWERSIMENFGLPEAQFDENRVLNSGTWSSCGDGRLCADDSDYFDASGGQAGGEREDDLASARRPTIFMWQPYRFELVPGDKLAEWERVTREHVGVPASQISLGDRGSATISATLPKDCMDDSDTWVD
jgi:hypothetical protein